MVEPALRFRAPLPAADQKVAVPRLELEALRSAFAGGARLVLAGHRAGLLAHPGVLPAAALGVPFAASCQGHVRTLPQDVARALSRAGVRSHKTREALVAEVAHMGRVFSGLVNDPAPVVRLVVVDVAGAPAVMPLGVEARTVLIHSFALPGTAGEPLPATHLAALLGVDDGLVVDLPAHTTAVMRLDPPSSSSSRPVAVPGDSGRDLRLVLCLASEREPVGEPEPPRERPEPADVVLVSMPFGPTELPSLALSLLQGSLPPGMAKTLYFNLQLAGRTGSAFYLWVAEFQLFVSALVGEWLFAAALRPEAPRDPRPYLDELLLRRNTDWLKAPEEDPLFFTLVPQEAVLDLLRLRDEMDAFVDACADQVLAHRPRVVGMTSVFQQHAASLALARRLKERAPEVAVVLGGSNCEGVMGLATLRCFPFVDAVVCGEGDVVFPQLVERVLAGRPIDDLRGVYTPHSPEVTQRSRSPANAPSPRLDDLPVPVFEGFFTQHTAAGLEPFTPRLVFETSRGCWWGEKQHCTFCGLNGTNMAFRSKSADRALAELRELIRRHPGLALSTADNIIDMKYFRTFLPQLAREGLDLQLFYEVKSNIRKEEIRRLREAGVREIQPGIESLDDQVLRIMRKGVSALQNIRLLKWCKEMEVWPFWNMLWGFPGEPPEAYAAMGELLPLLHHLPPPAGMTQILLERFSPNHFQSAELGFKDVKALSVYGHIYGAPQEDLDDLAYFFDYSYQDGRRVNRYARPLAQRVVEWRQAHQDSKLVAFDRGDRLLILDTRPVAVQQLTFVEGLARTLYLACDGISTVDHLRRSAAPAEGELLREDMEEALRPLVDNGFLLRQGDSLLALAIHQRLGSPGPAPAQEE